MSAQLTQQLSFPLGGGNNPQISAVPDAANAQAIVTCTGMDLYSGLSVVRVVNSVEYPIRGATNVAIGGTAVFVVFDYEAPLDVVITYRMVLDSTTEVEASPITIQTDGNTFWLKDVILGAFSCKVHIEEMSDVTRASNVLASFKVIGRANPVIVTDVRQGRTGQMTLTALDTVEMAQILDIVSSGNTLLFQSPANANFPDMYFQAGDVSEIWRGTSNTVVHSFSFSFTETDAPSETAFTLASNSWLLVAQFQNWNDVLNRRAEWTDVLVTPFSDNDSV